MKEHPILFSTPMVQAILEGRKTQTRRVVKPQREKFSIGFQPNTWFYGAGDDGVIDVDGVIGCPYGQPGDHLWVRETWAGDEYTGFAYKASEPNALPFGEECVFDNWKPSIHMTRSASRITLEIVNVRLERVREISEQDAKAEGVNFVSCDAGGNSIDLFANLWDSINTKRGYAWDTNPWVWVVEFKRQ